MEYKPPRINPKVNYGFWMIMVCQCGLNDSNKRTSLVQDIDSGGRCCLDSLITYQMLVLILYIYIYIYIYMNLCMHVYTHVYAH